MNGNTSLAERKRNEKGQHESWPLKIKKFLIYLTRLGSGAQAARTDFNFDSPAIFENGRLLQIGFPLTLGFLLRKADVVAGHCFLAAN
jgi:hypothetical protein